MVPTMRFHSATATGADLEAVCRQLAANIAQGMGPGPLDLAVVFATPRYGVGIERLPVLLQELLGVQTLVGCSGAVLIGNGEQWEGRHAITLLVGRLPGVQVQSAALTAGDLPDADAAPKRWHALLPATKTPIQGFVLLTDPFHCDAKALLAGLDYAWPDVPKLGGIASGSRHPEGHVLFHGRQTQHGGAVLLAFGGEIDLIPVVAQGCRPIGRAGRITRAERNRVIQIDDAPARNFLEEQLASLSGADLGLVEESPLFLGLGPDPFATKAPAAGNYLIRNVLGIDPATGNMLISDLAVTGRHVQLHIRDRNSSEQDLKQQLQRAHPNQAQAALMFRCLGREGQDHASFAALANGVPLVGFHCNGEIGPVAGSSHLHGFTTTVALLRRRRGNIAP